MLVLSRKTGESLLIGNDVTITVLSVHGRRIRLGIDAPTSITILRHELAEKGSNHGSSARRPQVAAQPASTPSTAG